MKFSPSILGYPIFGLTPICCNHDALIVQVNYQNQTLLTLPHGSKHIFKNGEFVPLNSYARNLKLTAKAPENQWLEDECLFGMAYFERLC